MENLVEKALAMEKELVEKFRANESGVWFKSGNFYNAILVNSTARTDKKGKYPMKVVYRNMKTGELWTIDLQEFLEKSHPFDPKYVDEKDSASKPDFFRLKEEKDVVTNKQLLDAVENTRTNLIGISLSIACIWVVLVIALRSLF